MTLEQINTTTNHKFPINMSQGFLSAAIVWISLVGLVPPFFLLVFRLSAGVVTLC